MVFRVERRHGKGILDIWFFGMAQHLETIKKFSDLSIKCLPSKASQLKFLLETERGTQTESIPKICSKSEISTSKVIAPSAPKETSDRGTQNEDILEYD